MSIYSKFIGDGSSTSFSIPQSTHGLSASQALLVEVVNVATGDVWDVGVSVSASGTVALTFSVAPTSNQFQVNIAG